MKKYSTPGFFDEENRLEQLNEKKYPLLRLSDYIDLEFFRKPLAAKNILKQGINILSGSGIKSYVKQKRDEALPLGKSTTPEAQPIASGVGG